MPTKLISLRIDHIAGVDRPANKRKFLVIKQEKDPPIEKAMSIKKEGEDQYCLYDENGDKVGTYKTMEEAQAAKEKMMSKGAVTMLTKEQIAKIGDKEVQEAAVKQQEEMLAVEKKQKELEEQLAKAKESPPKDDDEEIWKGVPPAIRNRMESVVKERDDFAKKAKDERDQRETDNWITKSRKFKYLQTTPEHFGKVMKAIAESCQNEAEEIYRILSNADEVIGKGAMFMEIGKVPNGTNRFNDATNVSARVEAMAEDFIKLDPKLSQGEAIDKVFKQNPDWYPVWRREGSTKI